jgi:spermidine synthase
MKHLQKKYAKNGFQVIQAHSAEYNFAKDVSNIQRALLRYNIKNIPVHLKPIIEYGKHMVIHIGQNMF